MIIGIYEYTCLLVFIFVFIGGLKDHAKQILNVFRSVNSTKFIAVSVLVRGSLAEIMESSLLI